MSDPYSVLGVSPNASEDEVKTAYRELAKKYHPDNYVNNPLADLASEKMQEINEAYDTIMKMRRDGGSGSQGSYQNNTSQNSSFRNVREYINNGRVAEAQKILDSVPSGERNAEWFFLKGSIFYKNGWINEAYTHFQRANAMDPNNFEYKEAFQRISFQMNGTGFGGGYGGGGFGGYNRGNQNGCSGCDICTGLMCADCCCQSLGGC